MRKNGIEYRIRRKSELNDFMGASIDELVEEEARQARARIAAEVIGSFVARCRVSAGNIGEMAIQARASEIRNRN
ncbi:hypothetical protein [Burkholderia latens]|uniref:hypothetical protein n=1 Tax=Burkholderia latens TaxID=488446 RepID=UPI001AE9A715|nr:hypothetical protein [Burkholderia latens]QTO46330.1 hypothetical protein J8I85_17945 [Burkholderia latens]